MQGIALADTGLPEIAQVIVERLAAGEYLRDICSEEGMPDRRTVQRWMLADEAFAAQCARAREMAAELDEEEVERLARAVEAAELAPEAARVAINARTWLAKVRNPKRYGDRVELEHKGRIEVVPVLNVTMTGPAPTVIDLTPAGE